MKKYSRRSGNINKKFFQFILPSLLTGLAFSLNEFVDSIIVSQLLGADAMSMVEMSQGTFQLTHSKAWVLIKQKESGKFHTKKEVNDGKGR